MQFYCPNCQDIVETEPVSTVVTKFNQSVFKAFCPVCNQDMAAITTSSAAPAPVAASTIETAA